MNTHKPQDSRKQLRKTYRSLNFALVSAGASVLISVTGAVLLIFNQNTQAAVITANGLVTSAECLQIAKDSKRRLDKILAELDDEEDDSI